LSRLALYLSFCLRLGRPRDLHSFPTRRSSDLLTYGVIMRHWLSHIAICVVFFLSGLAFGEELEVGDIAPNWMLVDHDNKAVSLYDQVGDGRIAVMVFWASWCAHSKKILPRLKHLGETREFDNVAFYLMNAW